MYVVVIRLCLCVLVSCKISEDDLKKIETCWTLSELHMQVNTLVH